MAKSIMIQGTMSNVGKSLLSAGLCRVFHQDGYRTVPFKSQNMALNSFITGEGLEMGRAQVVQAQAAGAVPAVAMNPILLKPTGESKSQVIVNGKVLGDMSARDYFAMKKSLVPDIRKAYDSLSEEADIIVIEGAGSPAEINLRDDDIVNMGMAKLAGAPVLLVGDIDRGGVFAQLYGTAALLAEDERRYLKGLVINKFRGDADILKPGLLQIEELVRRPVLGVIPYLHLDIDDEDSLSGRLDKKTAAAGAVDIAVIRLPRISNFTDFEPFGRIGGVSLRYISKPAEFGDPDLVLLPGTKNTIGDLLWMRENGLEACVIRAAGRGKAVMGICGGYQMLGETLSDPDGVENSPEPGAAGGGRYSIRSSAVRSGAVRGMGLLPVDTVFTADKVRTRVSGKITGPADGFENLRGREIEGYEIHMGKSQIRLGEGAEAFSYLRASSGTEKTEKADGCRLKNVCGTYVHGIFDGSGTAFSLASVLAEKKDIRLTDWAGGDPQAYREKQYDLLADAVRGSLDMEAVYRILEQGMKDM